MNVRINLKIILFVLLLLATKQIKIYLLLMIFAILHELGHIIMGLILGFKPERINIIPSRFIYKIQNEL